MCARSDIHGSDPCILCGNRLFRPVLRKAGWSYLQCTRCSLVSRRPKPSINEIQEHYAAYLPVDAGEITAWRSMMMPVVIASADLIESRNCICRGSLLDVGCGYGFFLHEMKCRGWDVMGIEISETGRWYTETTWDIPVYPAKLETLGLESESVDVVTLFYVIEHVENPPALLEEVRRILKPGGLVLLRWPHSTPIVKVLGPLSKKLDLYHTPYHLYDFSPATIRMLLRQAHFENITTVIGGRTRPLGGLNHWSSMISGAVAESVYRATGGRILFPGVSKTTLAHKDTD